MARSEPNAKPTETHGRERRAHPRAAADWPLEIALNQNGVPAKVRARVRDVSRAGVSFYVDRPIAMMTMLELALDLPSAQGVRQVRGRGAVVRCARIGAGVEHFEVAVFLHEISESDRRAIDRHVRAGIGAGALDAADDE